MAVAALARASASCLRRWWLVVAALAVAAAASASAGSGTAAGGARTASTSAAAGRGAAPQYRYIYDSDAAAPSVVAAGWNLVDVGSQWAADRLPRGARGLVWVGDYDNDTCSWELGDAALKSKVAAAARDPRVFGFFISDEPNPYACPRAPAQHAARSALIHSLAPRKRSVIVLDSNGFKGRATPDALLQLPLWKGTADVIGLDPYPCYQGKPCDLSWIDRTIRAADAAHLNYWGVVQAFDDSSWRWPTARELSRMLDRWAASRESGSMTFAWTWAGKSLSGRSELLEVFRRFNKALPPWRCVVPNLVGSTLRRARVAVAAARCVVGSVTRQRSPLPRGTIVAQRPRPGTPVPKWSPVNLVASARSRP